MPPFQRIFSICIGLFLIGCAAPPPQRTIDDRIRETINRAHDGMAENSKRLSDCAIEYVKKHYIQPASPSEIASAALVACDRYAWAFGNMVASSKIAANTYMSRQWSMSELDRQTRLANLEGENAANAIRETSRDVCIKLVTDLRFVDEKKRQEELKMEALKRVQEQLEAEAQKRTPATKRKVTISM